MTPLHLEVHQRTLNPGDSRLNPGSTRADTLRDDYRNIATEILVCGNLNLMRFLLNLESRHLVQSERLIISH